MNEKKIGNFTITTGIYADEPNVTVVVERRPFVDNRGFDHARYIRSFYESYEAAAAAVMRRVSPLAVDARGQRFLP
jgi:hypothetical protein